MGSLRFQNGFVEGNRIIGSMRLGGGGRAPQYLQVNCPRLYVKSSKLLKRFNGFHKS